MNTSKDLSRFVNAPKPLFDIINYLPEGIVPAQNGIMPPDKLQLIHCGRRKLYIDAARSWMAMVRAAEQEGIFLNLNNNFNAYRNITLQIKTFKKRFFTVNVNDIEPSDNAFRVEFNGEIWQLKEKEQYIPVPGQGSHGFGLAVRISNATTDDVKAWLDKNAGQFGWAIEYDFEPGHFAYIKSQESIPRRVFEMEKLSPEPIYTAAQIANVSDGIWIEPPPEDWICRGLFYSEPFRAECLAVIDQGEGIGIKTKSLDAIFRNCAGIICTNPEKLEKYKLPLLLTLNVQDTVQKLSNFFKKTAATNFSDDNENLLQSLVGDPLMDELNFYRKANPEAVIFQKKKDLARRLLKISVESLQNAPKQFWYEEYLALLAIRFENPILRFMSEKYVEELFQWYNDNPNEDERELAVLGMLQFMDSKDLPVLLDQHLWSSEMIRDVKGIFWGHYTRISYSDDDIANYYLYRQKLWKHKERKMRVVFLWNTHATAHDKMLPVYEILRERNDVEIFFVLSPDKDGGHVATVFEYFHKKYPEQVICNSITLKDLRDLRPDYLFVGAPYDYSIPTIGFHFRDAVQFTKICHITYGSNLAYALIDRLLDDHPQFYHNVYFCFCSGETVTERAKEKFKANVEMGYNHFEFLGYPILERYYQMPATKSSAKRILWTPRWNYEGNRGGSHFIEYKDRFVSLREKYGDKVELSIRPHKMAFAHFIKLGLMTEEGVKEYCEKLAENQITLHEAFADIDDNIRETDIFLADYSSMLIVLFLTCRPIIYCEFPNAIPLPEYEEMFNAMYIANSWEDVERYLDDLMAGNDPLFDKRQEIAKRLYELHKDSAQKIVERIVQDFKESQSDGEEADLKNSFTPPDDKDSNLEDLFM